MKTRIPFDIASDLKYGPLESQEGDLYLPHVAKPPVVCLLHGGFWRMPHGRDQFDAVANDIAARGYAVWNIEYRRLGAPGGGWPGTLDDAMHAIDYLATLSNDGIDLDIERVVVVGHSAGGHLALCVSARDEAALFRTRHVHPIAAVGLAAISNLAAAYETAAGNGAAHEFVGGAPGQFQDRYSSGSPIELLPLGVKQLIVHGVKDSILPAELSRQYASVAQASGDSVEYVALSDAGHMDFLDTGSAAHATLCAWLADLFQDRRPDD